MESSHLGDRRDGITWTAMAPEGVVMQLVGGKEGAVARLVGACYRRATGGTCFRRAPCSSCCWWVSACRGAAGGAQVCCRVTGGWDCNWGGGKGMGSEQLVELGAVRGE